MVKLSEEMIMARTRVSDMAHVKKLNCWGADLTDVSVLRKLRNVEVLSLSVNNITTLADVQDCKNLQVKIVHSRVFQDIVIYIPKPANVEHESHFSKRNSLP